MDLFLDSEVKEASDQDTVIQVPTQGLMLLAQVFLPVYGEAFGTTTVMILDAQVVVAGLEAQVAVVEVAAAEVVAAKKSS